MSVNGNDRVSSAKLKDVMDKLWDDRYLGKEPEVETEIETELVAVSQIPHAGEYASGSELINAFETGETLNTPIYVFDVSYNTSAGSWNIPVAKGEVVGTISYYFENDGTKMYLEDEISNYSEYSGYRVVYVDNAGVWVCEKVTNGTSDSELVRYIYSHDEPEEVSTTITTKTKHTVKQDFLPNADWNVNDPDADGYVEGRTHWVEIGEGVVEPTRTVLGSYQGFDDMFAPISGSAIINGDTFVFKPDFEAIYTESQGFPLYILAVDENGNQITSENINNTYTGIEIADYTDMGYGIIGMFMYQQNPVAGVDNYSINGVSSQYHKIDSKYIDFPEQIYPDYSEPNDIDVSAVYKTGEQKIGKGFGSNKYVTLTLRFNMKEVNGILYVLPNITNYSNESATQSFYRERLFQKLERLKGWAQWNTWEQFFDSCVNRARYIDTVLGWESLGEAKCQPENVTSSSEYGVYSFPVISYSGSAPTNKGSFVLHGVRENVEIDGTPTMVIGRLSLPYEGYTDSHIRNNEFVIYYPVSIGSLAFDDIGYENDANTLPISTNICQYYALSNNSYVGISIPALLQGNGVYQAQYLAVNFDLLLTKTQDGIYSKTWSMVDEQDTSQPNAFGTWFYENVLGQNVRLVGNESGWCHTVDRVNGYKFDVSLSISNALKVVCYVDQDVYNSNTLEVQGVCLLTGYGE